MLLLCLRRYRKHTNKRKGRKKLAFFPPFSVCLWCNLFWVEGACEGGSSWFNVRIYDRAVFSLSACFLFQGSMAHVLTWVKTSSRPCCDFLHAHGWSHYCDHQTSSGRSAAISLCCLSIWTHSGCVVTWAQTVWPVPWRDLTYPLSFLHFLGGLTTYSCLEQNQHLCPLSWLRPSRSLRRRSDTPIISVLYIGWIHSRHNRISFVQLSDDSVCLYRQTNQSKFMCRQLTIKTKNFAVN